MPKVKVMKRKSTCSGKTQPDEEQSRRKLTTSEKIKLLRINAKLIPDKLKALNNFEYKHSDSETLIATSHKFSNIMLKTAGKYAICRTMNSNGHIFESNDDVEICIEMTNEKKVFTYAKIIFFVINKEDKKASVFVKWYFKQNELTSKCKKEFKIFSEEIDAKNKSKIIFQSEMCQEIPIGSINRKVDIDHAESLTRPGADKFEYLYFHHYEYKKCELKKYSPTKSVSVLKTPRHYYKKFLLCIKNKK